MKRIILTVLFISAFLVYCSPEDSDSSDNMTDVDGMSGDDDDDDGGDNGVIVTYTGDVAAIISANCLECHGEVRKNGAPVSLHTYELLKKENLLVQFYMNDLTNPMPPESRGGLISVAERAIIDEWIADGLLEN